MKEEESKPVKSLFLYLSSIEAESPSLISQFYRSIHFLSSASVVTTTSHQSINQLRNIYLPLVVVKVRFEPPSFPTRSPSQRDRSQATIFNLLDTTILSILSGSISISSSTQSIPPLLSKVPFVLAPLRVSNPIFGLPFHRYHQGSRGSSTIGAGRVSWWTRPYTRITATSESRLLPNS